MVDRNNLEQVNMLYGEARAIAMALEGFDNGGRIVEMRVSLGPLPEGDPGPRPAMGVPVPTLKLDYPAEMVTAIRGKLQARKAEIDAELKELGLD